MSIYELQQMLIETFNNIHQSVLDHIYEATNRVHSSSLSGSSGGGSSSPGNFDPNNWKDLLTRTQERVVRTYENTVKDHLKKSDFEAVRNELNGVRYPKYDGTYWNHSTRQIIPRIPKRCNSC